MEEVLDFMPPKADRLKPGVSGLMRVKNDAEFIEACIDSCLPALDELIIVYNDCTDSSESIIRECASKYPHKIRVYKYPAQVLANNLTEAEFQYVISLPENSPHLLCNYYNFALSKANYSHAVKIDADQIYFTDYLQRWCDITRNGKGKKQRRKYILGKFVFNYFRIIRKISIISGKRVHISSFKFGKHLIDAYLHYAEIGFCKESLTLSLSGLNVYKHYISGWFIPLGRKCDPMNILPPFNGENDHLIFKITDKTFYKPLVSKYYNLQHTSSYSVIEEMVHPYIPINVGFCWHHLNACRMAYSQKTEESFKKHRDSYMRINEFLNTDFKSIEKKSDKSMFTLYQRILFSFLFENLKTSRLYKEPTFNH